MDEFGNWYAKHMSQYRARRTNGSTTFRRTSQATSATMANNSTAREVNSTHQPRNSSEGATPYIPPHASRNGASVGGGAGGDLRYSKDKFLEIFKAEKDAGNLLEGVDNLFIGGFHPSASNGVAGATWGRREEHKENHSVELCWDRNARMFPMSLHELTEEERDVSGQRAQLGLVY